MELAKRIMELAPSATLVINSKAQELKAKGQEVISLAVGEPDFSPPAWVKQAIIEAVQEDYFRYLPVAGTQELREAGAAYSQRFYGQKPAWQEVMFANGGKQCLFNLFQVLLDPGDEVLIPAPYWVSYPAMVSLAGGVPKIVPTSLENNFKIKIQDIESKLTAKTKILLLNSPSNPTGVHYGPEELESLARWGLEKGLFIISDEVYDQLVYPPAQMTSLINLWAEQKERVAIVNALSKSFGLTGLRVGFVVGSEQLVKAMSKLQGQSTSNICSLAQRAGLAALNGDFSFLEEKRTQFQKRRDLAMEKLQSLGVNLPKPDGAFYLFPDLSKFFTGKINNSTQLCTYLLEKAGVALVPGSAFGDDRCVRFSYAVSEQVLTKALDKVIAALKEI